MKCQPWCRAGVCAWPGCPGRSCLILRPATAVKVAPSWANDLDRGEDRDSVGLVAGAADRRAKSRTGTGSPAALLSLWA
jgi:hypothetical protein